MGVTALVALWLSLYQLNSSIAWLFLPLLGVGCFSLVFGRVIPFFWLPFFSSLNWVILTFMPWWTVPHEVIIPIFAGVVSVFSIYVYTIDRTLKVYRGQQSRDGVVFVGIGYSVVAGVFVGVMLGVPILALCIFNLFWPYSFDWQFLLMLATGLPFSGAFAGMILGIGFGFVCDIMVALEFKQRPRDVIAG